VRPVARPTSAPRWVALVMLAAFVLACGVIPEDPGPGDPGSRPGDRPSPTGDSMATDERTAVQITDTYWKRHFTELFGRTYRSPRVVGGYTGRNGPRCGGEPSVPFNAFYCTVGDFLAWDEDLMAVGYERIGDAWVYLIIAHEWAHAIQARLERDRVSVAAELQADCLAGASLQGAAQDGLVTIEPGDDEEIGQTLAAVADDYPWTSERDHGNARQRIGAFNQGAEGGPTACA
jgi:uncharacterized protein